MGYAEVSIRNFPNSEEVARMYIGIFYLNIGTLKLPSSERVCVDFHIKLASEDDQELNFTIEEGDSKPAEYVFSLSDPLVKKCLGLKLGETFEQDDSLGRSIVWMVKSIKPKMLYILHDLTEHFATRFPHAKGFGTIRMKDDDIEPALEHVRRASERGDVFVKLYEEHPIPLSMAAPRSSGGAIGFAQHLAQMGKSIITCRGDLPERENAVELLKTADNAENSSVVIDTLTAWTIASNDAFDLVKEIFDTLIIPQSVLDDLFILRDDWLEHTGERMSLVYHNGQYYRNVTSAEDAADQKDMIARLVQQIEDNCTVAPIEAPNEQSEVISMLSETFGDDKMDCAIIARKDHLLLSEDLRYRDFAKAEYGTEGIWLQSLFLYLRDSKRLDWRRYAELVIQLRLARHCHIVIDASTLLESLRLCEDDDLRRFTVAASCLGVVNADPSSHIRVATDFLDLLWSDQDIDELKRWATTNIVITALIRHFGPDWCFVLAVLHERSMRRVGKYICQWIKGHFLPQQNFIDAINTLRKNAVSVEDR